jgi:hypothetical protein
MPNFVEFSRETPRGSRDEPMFTLQARGLLSFNQAAFKALGEPVAVALLYDADEHIVAIRKVDRTQRNAHQVRKQQRAQSYLVSAQAFVAHHGIPTPRARRFPGVDYGNGAWGFALQEGIAVENRRGAQEPGTAITDLWRHTTDGSEVPALMRITHKAFSHRGYMRASPDTPPSLRVGTLMPCDPPGPTPTTSQLRSSFLAFLTQSAILDLVSVLSHIDSDARWRSLAGNGRLMLEAAMMAEDQDEAPVASAMLLLPQAGRSSFGGDPRCAEFVLHIEPRTPDGTPASPLDLVEWRDRFTRALGIPQALAHFLTHDLGLATPADPPAQLGLWLNSPHKMAELVDIGNLKTLPGSAQANWFIGYAIADREGVSPGTAAADLLGQMCDFTLHLDGWESVIDASHSPSQREVVP